jgi:hypothetical protein
MIRALHFPKSGIRDRSRQYGVAEDTANCKTEVYHFGVVASVTLKSKPVRPYSSSDPHIFCSSE